MRIDGNSVYFMYKVMVTQYCEIKLEIMRNDYCIPAYVGLRVWNSHNPYMTRFDFLTGKVIPYE